MDGELGYFWYILTNAALYTDTKKVLQCPTVKDNAVPCFFFTVLSVNVRQQGSLSVSAMSANTMCLQAALVVNGAYRLSL